MSKNKNVSLKEKEDNKVFNSNWFQVSTIFKIKNHNRHKEKPRKPKWFLLRINPNEISLAPNGPIYIRKQKYYNDYGKPMRVFYRAKN